MSSDAALGEYRQASPLSMSIPFFKRYLFQLCTYVVALFAKPLWFSYVIHAFGFRVSGYKLLWRRIRRSVRLSVLQCHMLIRGLAMVCHFVFLRISPSLAFLASPIRAGGALLENRCVVFRQILHWFDRTPLALSGAAVV